MNPILLAIIVVTVIGLIGAVILVAASIFMYVPVDERVEQITAVLAGANCGACGCAGCADYAKSVVEDGTAVNKCAPGGAGGAGQGGGSSGVEGGAATPRTGCASSAVWATAIVPGPAPSTPSTSWTASPMWTGPSVPAAVPVPQFAPTM